MSNTYTYDAMQSTVVVDGRFITGFQEGSFVEWSKDEDNFSAKVSAQGDVGVAKRNNTLGTITLTLAQTSPDVAYLKKLANTGQMFPIWAQTGGDTLEKIGGTKAMVKKSPDGTLSDEIEDRQFEIQVFDYTDQ
jgi:hypothetical protein